MRDEASPELIKRASQDRAEFAQLYDLYLPRVYAFCRRYRQNRQDAEDLTADVFEKALSAMERYEDRGLPFSAWLLRIAANTVIDRARRFEPSDVSAEELLRLHEDSFLAEWEEAFWLQVHVATLPTDQREVVRLRFYEDQRFADVARCMGRTEGAVKQLLRRALQALRMRIDGEMEGESIHE